MTHQTLVGLYLTVEPFLNSYRTQSQSKYYLPLESPGS
jgi:hypothetical protein